MVSSSSISSANLSTVTASFTIRVSMEPFLSVSHRLRVSVMYLRKRRKIPRLTPASVRRGSSANGSIALKRFLQASTIYNHQPTTSMCDFPRRNGVTIETCLTMASFCSIAPLLG